MSRIQKKVKCHRTLELIKKALINPTKLNNRIITNEIGTPQGNILSPLLSNIVLHELDLFMDKLKKSFDQGKSRRVNPKYHSLKNARHKTKNEELKKSHLRKMMQMNPNDPMDPKFKRIIYVRYADDFIVLIIGNLSESYSVRRKIKDFLKNKLGLELNLEKTSITNLNKGSMFLGAKILKRSKIIRKVKETNIRKRFSRKLSILAPLKQITEKLILNGFARRNRLNLVLAKSRRDLVNHSHYDIISFYNARINGILNFYSFAGNYDHIRRVL